MCPSLKRTIPTGAGIGGAKNALTPAIVDNKLQVADRSPTLNAKTIIFAIVVRCKGGRQIEAAPAARKVYQHLYAVVAGAAGSVGRPNGVPGGSSRSYYLCATCRIAKTCRRTP